MRANSRTTPQLVPSVSLDEDFRLRIPRRVITGKEKGDVNISGVPFLSPTAGDIIRAQRAQTDGEQEAQQKPEKKSGGGRRRRVRKSAAAPTKELNRDAASDWRFEVDEPAVVEEAGDAEAHATCPLPPPPPLW